MNDEMIPACVTATQVGKMLERAQAALDACEFRSPVVRKLKDQYEDAREDLKMARLALEDAYASAEILCAGVERFVAGSPGAGGPLAAWTDMKHLQAEGEDLFKAGFDEAAKTVRTVKDADGVPQELPVRDAPPEKDGPAVVG